MGRGEGLSPERDRRRRSLTIIRGERKEKRNPFVEREAHVSFWEKRGSSCPEKGGGDGS